MHSHNPKFGLFLIGGSELFYCRFPFLFLGPFTIATFKFHILSSCRYNLATWLLERERVQTNCKLYEEKPILSSNILHRLRTRREDIAGIRVGTSLTFSFEQMETFTNKKFPNTVKHQSVQPRYPVLNTLR